MCGLDSWFTYNLSDFHHPMSRWVHVHVIGNIRDSSSPVFRRLHSWLFLMGDSVPFEQSHTAIVSHSLSTPQPVSFNYAGCAYYILIRRPVNWSYFCFIVEHFNSQKENHPHVSSSKALVFLNWFSASAIDLREHYLPVLLFFVNLLAEPSCVCYIDCMLFNIHSPIIPPFHIRGM